MAFPVVFFLPFPYFFYNYSHDGSGDLLTFACLILVGTRVHFCFLLRLACADLHDYWRMDGFMVMRLLAPPTKGLGK